MGYYVITNEGNPVKVNSEVDIAALLEKMNRQEISVVKIGNKVMLKHLVAAVLNENAVTPDGKNVCINVARHNMYISVPDEDIEDVLEKAEKDINENNYALVGGVLINRGHYLLLEVMEPNA